MSSSSSVPPRGAYTKNVGGSGISSSSSFLPDVTWHNVAAYLPAPDVLSLLSVNRELRSVGRRNNDALWDALLTSQFSNFRHHDHSRRRTLGDGDEEEDEGEEEEDVTRTRRRSQRQRQRIPQVTGEKRQEFLALSYAQRLPDVEWVPLLAQHAPPSREGHVSCVLADRYWIVAGGYSTDTNVYVKDLGIIADDPSQWDDFHVLRPSYLAPSTTTSTTTTTDTDADGGGHDANHERRGVAQRRFHRSSAAAAAAAAAGADELEPGDRRRLQFAYGASLTPINDRQAILFGGFRAGGYSNECHQVAVLTLNVVEPQETRGEGRVDRDAPFSVSWRVVTTTLPPQHHRIDPHLIEAYLARAYHTATLLLDRYLLVLGGMTSDRSIWNPAVLDTVTWRWIVPRQLVEHLTQRAARVVPPRHGHSAVWDAKRSRIVVFGGGTGNDLLRSGIDHADVWATGPILNLDEVDESQLWRVLLDGDGDGPSPWTQVADATAAPDNSSSSVSPAELLCLGRCHVAHCVGPDTVLLAFGSGRPSTNGVLAFNLANDEFFRPRVRGPLPCPRFTTTCVLWNSYLICHGGFSTQRSSDLGDMHALDLAPALRRSFPEFRRDQQGHPGFAAVTDEEATELRNRGQGHAMGELEALISLLHNRGNMNAEEFHRTMQNVLPAEIIRRVIRARQADDDDEEDDNDDRNLDAEMEE